MANSEPAAIGGSSTTSLPRWFSKSKTRYEEEEVAFSPPEDGCELFSLSFGRAEEYSVASESPHKSTFDKINEELGYAEQVDGRRVSVSGGLPSRGSGLCLQSELLVHSQDQRIEELTIAEQQRHIPVKPLLVIPRSFARDSGSTAALLPADSNAPLVDSPSQEAQQTVGLPHGTPQTPSAFGDCSSSSTIQTTHPLEKDASSEEGSSEHEKKTFGILDHIRKLVFQTQPSSPTFSPTGSPKPMRKISAPVFSNHSVAEAELGPLSAEYHNSGGVLVERKMPTYNSFFYRPEREVVAATGAAVTSSGTTKPGTAEESVGAATQPQLMDGAVAAAAAATVTGKARRPKPSRLREMNFWAPTSM